MISLKFIPLTFITSNDEIIKQIKNTVVFSSLFGQCAETTFSSYIETTQYGFTASALESGSHRMLRITDINHSKVEWTTVPFCDCKDDEKYLLKDNDFLVARTGGTTGKSFLVNDPPSNAVFASYLIRIRLKKDVNIEFINAFLNSYCFWSQIIEMKSGSAQPNVNAEKLKELIIPDCDKETQIQAVNLLNATDSSDVIRGAMDSLESLYWNNDKIKTELSHQLDLVRQLRQAFLREAMQGKLVPQDETDEPAEVLLTKIKAEKARLVAEKEAKKEKLLPEIQADEIPFDIPSSWVWCRLGEVTTATSGGTPNRGNPDYWKGNISWLKSGEMTDGLISKDSEEKITEMGYKKSSVNLFPKGTLLIALYGATAGKLGILEYDSTTNQAVCGIFENGYIETKFLFYFLMNWRAKMVEDSWGQAQPNISQTYLKDFVFSLPPQAEQKRIVEKVEKLMTFCDELEANIRQSKDHAETLLQVALKEALEPHK